MGVKLFKTAEERIQWIAKTNPRGILQPGYAAWYKEQFGVASQFHDGQEVVVTWSGDGKWMFVMMISGRVEVTIPPHLFKYKPGEETKEVWG